MQRPLFPTCWVLKPPPLHCTSPLKPRKSCCRHCLIRRHISNICFFSSFFVSFLTSVAETSFSHMPGPQTPTSPPSLTPMPRLSSLASPHRCLCLTACKPGCLHLRHMQVHRHCH